MNVFSLDYVDRGLRSLEVAYYINAYYGFREELKTRFNLGDADSVYKHINSLFRYFPLCALVVDSILCMHGGISPKLNKLSDLTKVTETSQRLKMFLFQLKLPRDIIAQQRDTSLPKSFFPENHPLDLDLLWSDPNGDVDGFEYNEARQSSVWFGPQEVYSTCEKLGIKLIVRAHQAFNRGFGFFAGKRMVTLFGATDYVVKGSFAGILHLQLGNVQDKKGKPTEKKEIQAGIIIFRPATKETKGKKKFIEEFENFPEAEEDEETQLEILGKVEIFWIKLVAFEIQNLWRFWLRKGKESDRDSGLSRICGWDLSLTTASSVFYPSELIPLDQEGKESDRDT
ncbi:unnamed protein product [Meloidogyne enterolobii]|uniref:Uncharacterized protein n=1 Tax=Meloidogyne enterolobii TaxID=390850 RepID=A0ACB1AG76_MELEN